MKNPSYACSGTVRSAGCVSIHTSVCDVWTSETGANIKLTEMGNHVNSELKADMLAVGVGYRRIGRG